MRLQKIILSASLSCLTFIAFGQQTAAPLPKSKNKFVVIAHRGSHLVKPENTIASIEEAIQFGVDYVEIDLRTTKDGYLVLSHNETVDGRTNGKGRVQDLTLAEIKQLTVNSTDGIVYRVPEFKEVLKTCKNKINIYLDFKDADAAQAYKEIQAAGMEKNILVYINKGEQYPAWRKIAPKMPLMTGIHGTINTTEDLEKALKQMPIEATDNISDPAMISFLKEKGVSVFLDVQNKEETPEKWNNAISKGVQGVQTDHPEALIKYLKQNKLRP